MRSALISLCTLAVAVQADRFFSLGGVQPIVTTRLDPVVSPNMVSTHVHTVAGASRFKDVYDQDDLMRSNCTSVPVQPDKSAYWMPQLYHQDHATGEFTAVPTIFNIYYLFRPGPKNATITTFPPGFRMLAGDTNRRTVNASDFTNQAITFVCLTTDDSHDNDPDWAQRLDFFDHQCPGGMRAQVSFPSCWDGVNLDSPDHKSHVAYPIQNFDDGDCPDSHPVHLISLFYEMDVSVNEFDFWGPGAWVLANGDPTGRGHHGDFINGWDADLLQSVIDDCPDMNGNLLDCPPLAAAFDQTVANACVLETEIVDEDTGFNGPIPKLPGCNPVWDGTGLRPTCPGLPTPALVPAQSQLPAGWSEFGCIAEGATGRALTGASTTAANMTRQVCAGFCASKGFSLAGVEFADECYCDNQLRNNATMDIRVWTECAMHCAGNSNELCGGPNRLTLLTHA